MLELDAVDLNELDLTKLVLKTSTLSGTVSWVQEDQLLNNETLELRELGTAMATDGDILVVGAKLNQRPDGTVYVYEWKTEADGTGEPQWRLTSALYPSDRNTGDGQTFGGGFGHAVAISSREESVVTGQRFDPDTNQLVDVTEKQTVTRIVVGAPEDNQFGSNAGAAYIYERRGVGAWISLGKVTPNGQGQAFGSSVAIEGPTVAVGAPGDAPGNTNDSVYVFTYDPEKKWIETPISASLKNQADDFGRAVALAGGYLAVGAPEWDLTAANGQADVEDVGTVFIYDYNNPNPQPSNVVPTEPNAGEAFGSAVALRSNRLVVGAPKWDGVDADRADQGRAFVFDLEGGSWQLEARLTADGGLNELDASTEGRAGDNFGATVALDGQNVVAGAPLYDGDSTDVGAAYVFHEFVPKVPSGLGSTWVRSAMSGSGRLGAENPAGGDLNAPVPDRFGHSLAISGNRVMVGIPGFNDINRVAGGDVGAFQTFTTNGQLPAPTNESMWAEVLTRPLKAGETAGDDGFGENTIYNHETKTLFVAAVNKRTVYFYANEGLYWRPAGELTGGTSFGTDMDSDGTRLAIGAPEVNEVYLYEFTDGAWKPDSTLANGVLSGAAYGNGSFGSSVAIAPSFHDNGWHLVVGAEDAVLAYQENPDDPNDFAPLHTSGTAHLFRWDSGWSRERLLMPYGASASMPRKTSEWVRPDHLNDVTIKLGDAVLENRGFTPGVYRFSGDNVFQDAEEIILKPGMTALVVDNFGRTQFHRLHHHPSNTCNPPGDCAPITQRLDQNTDEPDIGVLVVGSWAPNPVGEVKINGTWRPLGESVVNEFGQRRYRNWYEAKDGEVIEGLRTGPNMIAAVALGGRYEVLDSSAEKTDLSFGAGARAVIMSTLRPNREMAYYPADRQPGLNGAKWGTSVDIVGSRVVVGATGANAIAEYDLQQPAPTRPNETQPIAIQVKVIDQGQDRIIEPNPLMPKNLSIDLTDSDRGAVVAVTTDGKSYVAGAPLTSGGGVAGHSQIGPIRSPDQADGDLFGAENALSIKGKRMLISSIGLGGGRTYLYDSDGNQIQDTALSPFRFISPDPEDANSRGRMEIDDRPGRQFGVGPSIISEHFYAIGSDPTENSDLTENVYNFRQRGPGWTSNSLTTAPETQKSHIGNSVSIHGNTVVVGAPGHDVSGAVFVYDRRKGSETAIRLQPDDLPVGAEFGFSTAIYGDMIVVGAPGWNLDGETQMGAVYFFEKQDGTWSQVKRSLPNNRDAVQRYGISVDIDVDEDSSGNVIRARAAVGGRFVTLGETEGFVTVLYKERNGWRRDNLFGNATNRFSPSMGDAVAIEGKRVVYGTPELGQVVIREKPRLELFPYIGSSILDLGDPSSKFGQSVDLSDNRIIVGAPGDKETAGAAYIINLEEEPIEFRDSDISNDRKFLSLAAGHGLKTGDAVLLKNFANLAFSTNIGVPNGLYYVNLGSDGTIRLSSTPPGGRGRRGGGFVTFGEAEDLATATLQKVSKLTHALGKPGDGFGRDVAIDGDQALVGIPSRGPGIALSYRLNEDGVWELETTTALTGGDAQPGDLVGHSVAISGNHAVLGAPQLGGRDNSEDTNGSAYGFVRTIQAPINVLSLDRQEDLFRGARVNTLSGTVGNADTATLNFFDIADVTIESGLGDDAITIEKAGVVAYGLQNLTIQTGGGNDILTSLSTNLRPPVADEFVRNLDGTTTKAEGKLTYDGGDGEDRFAPPAETLEEPPTLISIENPPAPVAAALSVVPSSLTDDATSARHAESQFVLEAQGKLSRKARTSTDKLAEEVDALFSRVSGSSEHPWMDERLVGDLDGNDVVDFQDFVAFARNFGRSDAVWADGDFTGDGHVDFRDFLMLSQNFGRRHSDPSSD